MPQYGSQGHQEFPPESAIKKTTQIAWFPTAFQPYFPTNEKEVCLCRPMESMFWTNEKLSLIVAIHANNV